MCNEAADHGHEDRLPGKAADLRHFGDVLVG